MPLDELSTFHLNVCLLASVLDFPVHFSRSTLLPSLGTELDLPCQGTTVLSFSSEVSYWIGDQYIYSQFLFSHVSYNTRHIGSLSYNKPSPNLVTYYN